MDGCVVSVLGFSESRCRSGLNVQEVYLEEMPVKDRREGVTEGGESLETGAGLTCEGEGKGRRIG